MQHIVLMLGKCTQPALWKEWAHDSVYIYSINAHDFGGLDQPKPLVKYAWFSPELVEVQLFAYTQLVQMFDEGVVHFVSGDTIPIFPVWHLKHFTKSSFCKKERRGDELVDVGTAFTASQWSTLTLQDIRSLLKKSQLFDVLVEGWTEALHRGTALSPDEMFLPSVMQDVPSGKCAMFFVKDSATSPVTWSDLDEVKTFYGLIDKNSAYRATLRSVLAFLRFNKAGDNMFFRKVSASVKGLEPLIRTHHRVDLLPFLKKEQLEVLQQPKLYFKKDDLTLESKCAVVAEDNGFGPPKYKVVCEGKPLFHKMISPHMSMWRYDEAMPILKQKYPHRGCRDAVKFKNCDKCRHACYPTFLNAVNEFLDEAKEEGVDVVFNGELTASTNSEAMRVARKLARIGEDFSARVGEENYRVKLSSDGEWFAHRRRSWW